eukprot:CAMPEP_0115016858 /NCGR_PEP_ID=MMETSP0216-20121206/27727_1 /TAXON_ID=223996 /ORGANISM="Protocruzia adherens, Strain Boccale" /LENGTH=453 /DNA_ID=CAMNT_0002387475 /DNA_START=74 /DNA_END=1435 /DNA_ORIENTATION=+
MREIVSIHLGQAGCQIADDCWSLFRHEHQIDGEGRISSEAPNENNLNDRSFGTFFSETSSGQYVPRAIFADLEPSVIDSVRTGSNRKLYNSSNLFSYKEDAANNFARGRYGPGREIIDDVIERIRKLADNCDEVEGFMMTCAMGGGTGSGFGSLLLEKLSDEYGTIPKLLFPVFPSSQMVNSVVEPYNTVMMENYLIDHSDITPLLCNEALFSMCKTGLGIEKPGYSDINSIIAQTMSSLTTSMRFSGSLNVDLNDFQTNLIPYPKIHFMTSSLAPLISSEKSFYEAFTVPQITKSVFDKTSLMVDTSLSAGKFMACSLMYRGDVVPNQVYNSLNEIKESRTIEFVDWVKTGFKVGLNLQAPMIASGSAIGASPRGVTLISNSTAIRHTFARVNHKFDLLFSKSAFVHWFVGEGMEQGEFMDARENMACLEKDYEECESENIFDPEADEEELN